MISAELPGEKRRPRLLRLGDWAVMALVLLLAAASFLWLYVGAGPGSRAVVTTPDGERVLPLSQNTELVITGKDGIELTLEVTDGRIRFRQSGCPDKICVHSGWLSKRGQTAACLPAGVSVRIEGGDGELDAVAG